MASDSDQIFLMNCWYVAAWDHELIDGAKLGVMALGVGGMCRSGSK